MALQPELQYTAQHRILRADIGVITNVRRDHTDVMGDTLAEICDALCNTVPRGGVLFTGERTLAERMSKAARRLDSELIPAYPNGAEPSFDFPENIALACAVCEHLGVDRNTALAGMARFKRDPFALTLHTVHNAFWINGLSINDVQSTCMVWENLKRQYGWSNQQLILLVNNRADRGGRTQLASSRRGRALYNQVIILSVIISLIYTELTGYSAGLIISGYLALNLQNPTRLAFTLLSAGAAVLVCRLLAREFDRQGFVSTGLSLLITTGATVLCLLLLGV